MAPPKTLITTTVSMLVALVATSGCKSKKQEPPKQAPTQPVASGSAWSGAWIERLPELADGGRGLALDQASNVVGIAADGSLTINPLAAATPVKLDGLAKALELPPVAPRRDTGFVAVEASTPGLENPTDIKFAKLGHPALASGSPAPPHRLTTVFSIAHPNDVSGGIVVLADANAPASALVDVLAQVGGFVAVRTGKELRALPLAIDRQPPAAVRPDQRWVELRLDMPVDLTKVSTDALDVLVAPQTKVSELIKLVGELRAAKVEAIGFGHAPAAGSPDAAARAQTGPRVMAWNFAVSSPDKLDTPSFRTAFDATLEPMKQCYATAVTKLAKSKRQPQTAQVGFALRPNQKSAAVEVSGVDDTLTKCIGDAVSAASFPSVGASGALGEVRISLLPE